MRAVKNNWLRATAVLTLALCLSLGLNAFTKKAAVADIQPTKEKILVPQDLTVDISSATNPNDATEQMVTHVGITDSLCGTSNATICGATFNLDFNDAEVQRLLQDIEDENPVTVQDFIDAGYTPSYKLKP